MTLWIKKLAKNVIEEDFHQLRRHPHDDLQWGVLQPLKESQHAENATESGLYDTL